MPFITEFRMPFKFLNLNRIGIEVTKQIQNSNLNIRIKMEWNEVSV